MVTVNGVAVLILLVTWCCTIPTSIKCEDVDEATKGIPEYWSTSCAGEMPDVIRHRIFPVEDAHIQMVVDTEGVDATLEKLRFPFSHDIKPVPNQLFYSYYTETNKIALEAAKSLFLRVENLHKGTATNLRFMQQEQEQAPNKAYFLPRTLADAIPFSSKSLPTAMKMLKMEVGAASPEAEQMKTTLKHCESRASRGETKRCATSLESMLDFAALALGTTRVTPLANKVPEVIKDQNYIIDRFIREPMYTKMVACHGMQYPYAVYLCHATTGTSTSVVELVGEDDGTKVEAVVVCHYDTSEWNPRHVGVKVLGIKPGDAPICHFVPNDNVVWVPAF